MMSLLPQHALLDIGAFSRLFVNTTNSYKHLFFQSLLSQFKKRLLENRLYDREYPIDDLIVGMLQFSWYSNRYFQLSYGSQDQVAKVLAQFDYQFDEFSISHPSVMDSLGEALKQQFQVIRAKELGRYVPYRLLSPFLEDELKGVSAGQIHSRIVQLSSERNNEQTAVFDMGHASYTVKGIEQINEKSVLYSFNDNVDGIILHPLWQQYLLDNLAIVEKWALYEWATFLQKRNPNSPSILNKIQPIYERQPLNKQAKFWREVMAHSPVYCIYSGQKLEQCSFALDHFLPWSFIGHDEQWNLIPATTSANSSKGRKLPRVEHVEQFIEVQTEALITQHRVLKVGQWKKLAQQYIDGLMIEEEALLEPDLLRTAYRNKLSPLISLASNLGYASM